MNFTKSSQDLLHSEPECEREGLIRGPTGQRDPLDSDTETGESSLPAELDDGEVLVESRGTIVTLSPTWTYRGAKP